MTYLAPRLDADADRIAATMIARAKQLVAGLELYDGQPETWLLLAAARVIADVRATVTSVTEDIFRFASTDLIGVSPLPATPARTTSTWTAVDTAGYTIPAGTRVALSVSGDQRVAFSVVTAVTIPPGSTATAAGAVSLVAVTEGLTGNALPPQRAILLDQLGWVSRIDTVAATTGGANAETSEAFLARAVNELALLTPRPIQAKDYAVLARRQPGVARALGLDNYNPAATPPSPVERSVTIAVVDAAGEPLTAAAKQTVANALSDPYRREVNALTNVIDPTYTTVNVTFTITVLPGLDAASTVAGARTAVTNYLSPAVWAGGDLIPPEWRVTTNVYYLEVASLLDRQPGVDRVVSLTLNTGTADVALAGAAPLTRPGTITGSAQ